MGEKLPRGIRKRGKSYKVEVMRNGQRRGGSASTLAEAIQLRDQITAELTGARPTEPIRVLDTWTLAKAHAEALETVWKNTKAEKTALKNANAALAYFGRGCLVEDINQPVIMDYIRHLVDQGNANATINRKLSALRVMLRVAWENGGLPQGIPPFPKRRKEPKGRLKWYTYEEEQSILITLDRWGKHDMRDLVILLIDTGFRLAEGLGLTSQNVSLKANQITLFEGTTKTDEPRSVPMTKRVREVVVRRMSKAGVNGLLFDMTYSQVRSTWDRVRAHLGKEDDPEWIIHNLRRTCLSRLVQAGVDLYRVMKWAGHRNFTTTQRYAYLSPKELHAVVHVLEPTDEDRPGLRAIK